MPKLFGLDIARLVDQSIRSAGGVRTGVLTRRVAGTRTADALAAGVQPTSTDHTCRGFVDFGVFGRQGQREDSTIPVPAARVSILGASLSVIPAVNDLATFDGRRYVLLELLEADPAAALYVFRAEEG